MQLTPRKIQLLLNTYAFESPFIQLLAPSWLSAAEELVSEGLMIKWDYLEYKYKLTEKGLKFVEMLLSTPIPIQAWLDPREISK